MYKQLKRLILLFFMLFVLSSTLEAQTVISFKRVPISDSDYKDDPELGHRLPSRNVMGYIDWEHFIDNLKKYHISTIQITLDGDKDCHNAKRHFRDGIGTFDLILRNITRILDTRESDVIVKINLDHNNLSTFPAVKQSLLERFNNDPLLTVSHNFIRNRTNFKDNGTCLSDLDYFDFFYEPKDAERILSNFVGPCPLRISNHIVISANGDIQKCLEQVGDSNHAIGNVNASVISVKKSSFYKLFSLPFTREDCKLCSILPLCGGGCPMDILKNGQPICNALKYRIQQVVRDYYLYHTK